MAQFSFDIVSEIDMQEVDNAVNQVVKEIRNRFDFKGSKSTVELHREEKLIKIVADDDMKLRNLHDILRSRFAARNISQKALIFNEPEKAFEGTIRQTIGLVQGIAQDKAKKLVKLIKDSKLKVQASIQQDQLRITSKSKDELQGVMQVVKSAEDLDIAVQFTNYR